MLALELDRESKQPGIEYQVQYDLRQVVERYHHQVCRYLYHADRFVELCDLLRAYLQETCGELVPTFSDQRVSYEFDAFLIAASALIEAPFREHAEQLLPPELGEQLRKAWPSRADAQSLFWRATVLRNRATHPDHAAFTASQARFAEFSSRVCTNRLEHGKLVLKVHLLDTYTNPELEHAVASVVIPEGKRVRDRFKLEKKQGKHAECRPAEPDLFQVVFSQRGAKSPPVVMLPLADLAAVFRYLVRDFGVFTAEVNHVFARHFIGDLK